MYRRDFLKLLGKGAVISVAVAALPKLSEAKEPAQDKPEKWERHIERVEEMNRWIIPLERYAETLGIHLWPQLPVSYINRFGQEVPLPKIEFVEIKDNGVTSPQLPISYTAKTELSPTFRHRIFRENEFCHDDTVMVNFNGKA